MIDIWILEEVIIMNNSLNEKYQRLKTFIYRERGNDISIYMVILFHLPLKLLSKSYSIFVVLINDLFMNKLFNISRFKNFQNLHKNSLNNHFYVIVMPNILHLLNPCLKLIPKNIDIFLILNGTRSWEEKYLRDNYAYYPIFKLITFPHSSLLHGSLLNLLIENNQSNFGIMDHDLYIFNKEIFNKLIFNKDECVIGAFKLMNKKSGLTFPTTHFMFFNVSLIKKIMVKYRIGAQIYTRIPSRLINKLSTINLGYNNSLKDYLHYFDAFNMILAMAFYEKLPVKILKLNDEDIYHIGGTSSFARWHSPTAPNSLYLTYLNMKLLEMPQNSLIRQRYSFLYPKFNSSNDVYECFPKKLFSLVFVANANKLITRIEQHT